MCRWNAYYGQPLIIDELLFQTEHGLIDQSLHSRMGVETTNGDGFGLGWYGELGGDPCRYRTVTPAWSDVNLRDMASHIASPLWLAHIRATTGTPVQQTNCHPFRYGNWLWVHNGAIRSFELLKRDLVLAVAPELYPSLAGSTDSEVMFHLALTYGLRDEPVAAVERMVGFVESVGRAHGEQHPIQMTVATTDGDRVWAFRYSSEGASRTLYVSTAVSALRELYPENETFRRLSDETRIIVSEPLGELVGAWQPVPESSYGIVQQGPDVLGDFRPRLP